MYGDWFQDALLRKTIVTGHYGSGKTEFAVSLAMLLSAAHAAKTAAQITDIALIDLDIINPYFRSREQRDILDSAGVAVYGSAFEREITAELPALGAAIRKPLEDKNTRVIIDLGGNDSGALILNQFAKYFSDSETMMAAVINANRPETSGIDAVLAHIAAIEAATEITVSHLINNTHMLRETTPQDIEKGHNLCMEICAQLKINLLCDCYPEGVIDPKELAGLSDTLMPLGLYLRPTWLDR